MNTESLTARIQPLTVRQRQLLARQLGVAAHKRENSAATVPDNRLVAYISGSEDLDEAELRKYLRQRLPEYMIPARVVPLVEIPRLPNGKIDRRALRAIPEETTPVQSDFVAAHSPVEQLLTGIWEEVLDFHPVGIHDNFFEIGGDSILSIQIVSKVQAAGLPIKPNHPFEYQTIAELATMLEPGAEPSTPGAVKIVPSPAVQTPEAPAAVRSVGPADSFPLSPMQEALLFHNQYAGNTRLGLVQVCFTLLGHLDQAIFLRSWQEVIDRQPTLRTSIHLAGSEEPKHVLHPRVQLRLREEDWSAEPASEYSDMVTTLVAKDQEEGFDFSRAPVMRLTLVRAGANRHYLLWSTHHLLLDGWSWSLLFRDVFANYQGLVNGQPFTPLPVRPYSDFIRWLGRQDQTKIERFWRKNLAGLAAPTSIGEPKPAGTPDDFQTLTVSLPAIRTQALQSLVKSHRMTLNVLMQGAWALLLHLYTGSRDVIFGKAASGRAVDVPGIENMLGPLTNYLPVRLWVFEDMQVADWLQYIFEEQAAASPYEQTPLHQIQALSEVPPTERLFESMLIYQNYRAGNFEAFWSGELETEIIAGGSVTTFPLTLMIVPGDALTFHLIYDRARYTSTFAKQLLDQFEGLLAALVASSEGKVAEMISGIEVRPPAGKVSSQEAPGTENSSTAGVANYVPPRNEEELQLVRIWESLFDRSPIGTTENFFELGGRSLLALQLFSKMESVLGRRLPPATLLEHPTAGGLARLLRREEAPGDWSCLVPLRSTGNRPPLFCVHAGGAHVFFYKPLAQHLGPEQPVYGIQPVGLDGASPLHKSIEDMAAHYLREIRSVQAHGPYHLLGTCFSNLVVLEMAHQLSRVNEAVALLAIIDSAPKHPELTPTIARTEKQSRTGRYLSRAAGFVERMRKDPRQAVHMMIRKRFPHWYPSVEDKWGETEKLQAQRLRDVQKNLISLYDQYRCIPLKGKVTLFRSSEYTKKSSKDTHLTQWSELALEGLEVREVPGSHKTLFQEPEVEGLAAAINRDLAPSEPKTD